MRRSPIGPRCAAVLIALFAMVHAAGALSGPVFAAAASQPTFLATGKFVGTDDTHKGEGNALIVQLPNGVGNQNYELASSVDITKFKSVVIYCKRFSVLFASAELAFNR